MKTKTLKKRGLMDVNLIQMHIIQNMNFSFLFFSIVFHEFLYFSRRVFDYKATLEHRNYSYSMGFGLWIFVSALMPHVVVCTAVMLHSTKLHDADKYY